MMAVLLENSKVRLTLAPLASDQTNDLKSNRLGSVEYDSCGYFSTPG